MKADLVLAKISWGRSIVILGSPFFVLTACYLLLSNRSLHEVFSLENWETPTTFRSYPLLANAFVALFLVMIAYRLWKLMSANGRYLWISDGNLMLYSRSLARLKDLESEEISFRSIRLNRFLVIRKRDGTEVVAQMTFGQYDEDLLKSILKKAIDELR